MTVAYRGLKLARGRLALRRLRHRYVRQLVQAPHPLVVHLLSLQGQQLLDALLAKVSVPSANSTMRVLSLAAQLFVRRGFWLFVLDYPHSERRCAR